MRHTTAALLLLAALLGSAAASGRRLHAPSPTEKLNAQRTQAQSPASLTPTERLNAERQQQQEAAARAAGISAQRLRPPCFVPTSFYPYQTCGVSQDAAICGRGYLSWRSMGECCARQRGAIGAFKEGCTDLTKNVTCWVAGSYYPTQTCQLTDDVTVCVGRNWGRWASEAECCAPGRGFADGCTKSQPCWVANAWYPTRACGLVQDDETCLRGWGAFGSEEECCEPGAAHSEGCGAVPQA